MTNGRLPLTAWMVVWSAFAIFAVLAVGVPAASLRYLRAATLAELAAVERIQGSLTLEKNSVTRVMDSGSGDHLDLPEGTTVTTHSDGRAFVTFFDGGTAAVEPGSRLRLITMRRPRFAPADSASNVVLAAEPNGPAAGNVTVGSTWRSTAYSVRTPHATVELRPDSRVTIRVSGSETRVDARAGQAVVAAAGTTVTLETDLVTTVASGRGPSPPESARANVLANPDFSQPPQLGWGRLDIRDDPPPGRSHRVVEDGREAVILERSGSEGRPGSVHWRQELDNMAIEGASYLGISITLKVDDQSLRGGERSTEYPVIVKVVVEPFEGTSDDVWQVGFFAVPPEGDWSPPPHRDQGIPGVPVPQGEWVTLTTGNLVDPEATPRLVAPPGSLDTEAVTLALTRLKRFVPAPRRLLRVELYASGHDFRAFVDQVGLWLR